MRKIARLFENGQTSAEIAGAGRRRHGMMDTSSTKFIPDLSGRRLDLAVIIPSLAKYGGAERYLVECLHHWQDRHDITIYSTTINRSLLSEHGIGVGIKCIELTPCFEGEHAVLLNAVLAPKIWQREIGKHDLYHAHLWPTHLIDLHPMVWFPHEPFRAARDLRYEQNIDVIGEDLASKIHQYPKFNYDLLHRSTFDATLNSINIMDRTVRPERVVANSRYTAQYLEDVYGYPVEDVVYPGVRLETVADLPIDPNLFVTVAQLWSHKRVSLLIEAIALTDDTQLVVIGSGPQLKHLEELADRLGVSDRVFFLSELNNQELQLVLTRACAFLYAAINEPFGIAVLEAMAAGKPVIAVNQGGYVEVCLPDFAFLLPPYPSAFAEKITQLQRTPDLARRMGRAAKNAAASYTWKRTAQELETLLLETWSVSHVQLSASGPERGAGPLIGIQYYAWYGDGFGSAHWNDTRHSGYVRDKPLLGYYSSSRGQTIDFHLNFFKQMDLDFVIVNLHVDSEGVNGLELLSAKHLFEIAQQRGSKLRIAVQLALYTADPEEVERVILMVKEAFVSLPNYLHLKTTPALFWFWSTVLDGNKKVIDRMAIATKSLCNIALSPRLPQVPDEDRLTFGFFSGFAPFSPLELAGEKHRQEVWTEAYRSAQRAGMAHRIVTISPGYDDRGLDDDRRAGNPYRTIPRRDGKTYQEMMNFVESLTPEPELVIISTFNEYHENTHIEPSLYNGMRYIDTTRQFVECLRSK
jgi:glycosyltransferase involved in cell wall biosynthesis